VHCKLVCEIAGTNDGLALNRSDICRYDATIGHNAVDDDRRIPENTEEEIYVLRVESIDVILDRGLDFRLASA